MNLRTSRLAVFAAVIFAAAVAFVFRIRHGMVDFAVNYTAGDRIRHGETLYRSQDEHYQFKYSPSCAIIYLPLSFLPLPAAKGVWFALVLATTFSIALLTRRLVGGSSRAAASAAVAWATLILAKFLVRELSLGQINAIVTAILLEMTVLLEQDEGRRSVGKAAAAGFLWGVAMALKPYAAIFLPYFVLKRKWNVLWPGLLVLVLTFIAPAAFYGFPGNLVVHEEWLASLAGSTPGLLTSQDNVSLLAFLMKWTGDIVVSRLAYVGAVLALAVAIGLFIRRGRGATGALPGECGLLLLAIPLVSPLGWDYTFLASFLAVSLVIVRFGEFPPLVRVFLAVNFSLIGATLYDFMGRSAYAAFMKASALTINFLVLATALFYLRFSGKV